MTEDHQLRAMVERHENDLYRGNGKPALTVRVATIEKAQEDMEKKIDHMQLTLEELPTKLGKMLLMWLSIAVAIITIITFLGPSLRKTIGLSASNQHEVTAQFSTNEPRIK